MSQGHPSQGEGQVDLTMNDVTFARRPHRTREQASEDASSPGSGAPWDMWGGLETPFQNAVLKYIQDTQNFNENNHI